MEGLHSQVDVHAVDIVCYEEIFPSAGLCKSGELWGKRAWKRIHLCICCKVRQLVCYAYLLSSCF